MLTTQKKSSLRKKPQKLKLLVKLLQMLLNPQLRRLIVVLVIALAVVVVLVVVKVKVADGLLVIELDSLDGIILTLGGMALMVIGTKVNPALSAFQVSLVVLSVVANLVVQVVMMYTLKLVMVAGQDGLNIVNCLILVAILVNEILIMVNWLFYIKKNLSLMLMILKICFLLLKQ